jgi:hypothetical protein
MRAPFDTGGQRVVFLFSLKDLPPVVYSDNIHVSHAWRGFDLDLAVSGDACDGTSKV